MFSTPLLLTARLQNLKLGLAGLRNYQSVRRLFNKLPIIFFQACNVVNETVHLYSCFFSLSSGFLLVSFFWILLSSGFALSFFLCEYCIRSRATDINSAQTKSIHRKWSSGRGEEYQGTRSELTGTV